jgi:hypothetical protein
MKPAMALVAAVLVAVAGTSGGSARAEPPATGSSSTDVPGQVRAWVARAYRSTTGIRPGLAADDAVALAKDAAPLTGDYLLPLSGAYQPPKGMTGSMRMFLGDKDARVSTVQLVLLVPKYDRAAMAAALVAGAKELGLELEPDEEEPDTYCGFGEDGARNLWVGLGEGVIAVDVDER